MSKIPKTFKQNTISGDLERSRKIASNLDIEIKSIKVKYNKTAYPGRFIESVIRDFIIPEIKMNRLLFHQTCLQ